MSAVDNRKRSNKSLFWSTLRFWLRVIGIVLAGVSLFSLYVTANKIGLFGVAALVHEEYSLVRDGLFQPIIGFVQFFIPDFHIPEKLRDAIVAALMTSGVIVRVGEVPSDVSLWPYWILALATLLFFAFAASGTPLAIGFAILLAISVSVAVSILERGEGARSMIKAFVLNWVLSVGTAIALLALNISQSS